MGAEAEGRCRRANVGCWKIEGKEQRAEVRVWKLESGRLLILLPPESQKMLNNRMLIFVLSILVFCSVGFAEADQLIVPGQRIGDIKLGMKMDEVTRILGNPDKDPSHTEDGLLEYHFMKSHLLMVDVEPSSKTVKMIATGLISSYKTSNGIQIGSPVEEVQKQMGSINLIKLNETSYTLKYPGKGIEFILRDKDGKKTVFIILIRQRR